MVAVVDKPYCFNCKAELSLPDGPVARGGSCPNCLSDLRCCFNCKHYDPSCYNECREPSAERVLDKDRGNFCDYFAIKLQPSGSSGASTSDSNNKWKRAADDIFK